MRLASFVTIALVVSLIAAVPKPAASYQLPIPGFDPSILGQAGTFFNQAVSGASPQTMGKITDMIGLFKSGAQNGSLTDGASQVKSIFPNATNEQQAVLQTTGFSGLISQLGLPGLEKLDVGSLQSLLSGFSGAQTNMSSILQQTHNTPSSVISHL